MLHHICYTVPASAAPAALTTLCPSHITPISSSSSLACPFMSPAHEASYKISLTLLGVFSKPVKACLPSKAEMGVSLEV